MADNVHIGDLDHLRTLRAQKEKHKRIFEREIDDLDQRIAQAEGSTKQTTGKGKKKQS